MGEATKSLIKILSEESVFTAEQVLSEILSAKSFQMVLILQGYTTNPGQLSLLATGIDEDRESESQLPDWLLSDESI